MSLLLIAAGLILVIGTAGASDCGMLTVKEIVIRAAASCALMFFGSRIRSKRR